MSRTAKSGWSRILRNIVGTTNVWFTRNSSTALSHAPASKRGRMTVALPEYKVIRRPSVPPMWKRGTEIMSTRGSTSRAAAVP